jgi:hypothetical protein
LSRCSDDSYRLEIDLHLYRYLPGPQHLVSPAVSIPWA